MIEYLVLYEWKKVLITAITTSCYNITPSACIVCRIFGSDFRPCFLPTKGFTLTSREAHKNMCIHYASTQHTSARSFLHKSFCTFFSNFKYILAVGRTADFYLKQVFLFASIEDAGRQDGEREEEQGDRKREEKQTPRGAEGQRPPLPNKVC